MLVLFHILKFIAWIKKSKKSNNRGDNLLRANSSRYSVSSSQISRVSREESYVDNKGKVIREVTMAIYEGKAKKGKKKLWNNLKNKVQNHSFAKSNNDNGKSSNDTNTDIIVIRIINL